MRVFLEDSKKTLETEKNKYNEKKKKDLAKEDEGSQDLVSMLGNRGWMASPLGIEDDTGIRTCLCN